MGKVKQIANEIRSLSRDEVAELRRWFRQFDADAWDREIEADVRAGRLDALAEEALEAHRAGRSKPL